MAAQVGFEPTNTGVWSCNLDLHQNLYSIKVAYFLYYYKKVPRLNRLATGLYIFYKSKWQGQNDLNV